MHRQVIINNSAFENEQGIGKAVADWTTDYNTKHGIKASTIIYRKKVSSYLHIAVNRHFL